jgi:hypothetical protein
MTDVSNYLHKWLSSRFYVSGLSFFIGVLALGSGLIAYINVNC